MKTLQEKLTDAVVSGNYSDIARVMGEMNRQNAAKVCTHDFVRLEGKDGPADSGAGSALRRPRKFSVGPRTSAAPQVGACRIQSVTIEGIFMSLSNIDLRTLSAVLVTVDECMEFCGICRATRDAVRDATVEKIVALSLKANDLKELPTLMMEAAPEHIEGHPSRAYQKIV